MRVRGVKKINQLGASDRLLVLVEARREEAMKNVPIGTFISGTNKDGYATMALNQWQISNPPTHPEGSKPCGEVPLHGNTLQNITVDGFQIISPPITFDKALGDAERKKIELQIMEQLRGPGVIFPNQDVADQAKKTSDAIKKMTKEANKDAEEQRREGIQPGYIMDYDAVWTDDPIEWATDDEILEEEDEG